ncbi:class I SAM-dependent methyltransferase [Pedobacter sp.]
MSQYEETFNTWNKVAKIYEEKFMHLDLYNETYDTFCKALTGKHAKILEVGCGPGNIAKYILNQNANFEILGIDIAPNMIELAKQNNPNTRFEVMDARAIDQLKTKFNGVIAGFCIPYLSLNETQHFISNSHQLLDDDGVLYISFVEGKYSRSGFKTNSSGDKVYFYYYELATITNEIEKLGFKAAQILKVNFKRSATEIEEHTIIITRKSNR